MKRLALALVVAMFLGGGYCARAQDAAQKKYDPGASDGEIKVGNLTAYTGVSAPYGVVVKAEAAYFRMINEGGGINGRKINFISLDTGSQPARTPELARQLVEQDGVLLLFSTIGTEANLNIRAYLNDQQIPQLLVQSSAAVFNNPAHYPWTMGFFAPIHSEGSAYARYLLDAKPNAKIAILYGAGEDGREYVAGVHDGLGAKGAAMIVKEVAYDGGDMNAALAALKNSGADVFLNLTQGVVTTRSIRAAYDAGWRPLEFIPNASLSVAAFLDPAGLEKSKGIVSNAHAKGWWSAPSQNDPAVREFLDFMRRYNPQASLRDQDNLAGYLRAQVLVEILRRCGDDLTRANVMRQATHLDMTLGMLWPGVRVSTTPDDYQPIKQLYLVRFDGSEWVPFGPILTVR